MNKNKGSQRKQTKNGVAVDLYPSVLLAAAECAPFAKTGGLADVVGALPKSLAELGIDARVIIPYHKVIKEKFSAEIQHLFYFFCDLGWRHEYVGIEKMVYEGVTVYLIDNEKYFGDAIYRGGEAEGEQYSFFCRAVLDCLPNLDFKPDIIHCNDWHTAMIPMLAKTQYNGGAQEQKKFLLTIHNIAFQGKYSFDFVKDLLSIDPFYYSSDFLEMYGCANYLKAGCVFSDKINTVSPSYAEEIKTPYYSEGLDGILNARASELSGIINGIDYTVFDPNVDPLIKQNYSVSDLSGKAVCKEALQKRFGLVQNPDIPLISMVSRMTEQKGFELVISILDKLMEEVNAQFVLLGSGDSRFEGFMKSAADRWKGKIGVYIGYNDELAHEVYAGSDYLLMPSRFEPCGLSQMIAMRYGTVPVVHETGGLRDTVEAYNKYTGTGNGFSFADYDAQVMLDIVKMALEVYSEKNILTGLIRTGMGTDFSFNTSAVSYLMLYRSLLKSGNTF